MEVGPGLGALTAPLAARIARGAGRLVAVELDSELAQVVRGRFADAPQVEVREGDFLRTSIPPGARVVANLPFAITSDAVRHITASEARDAHLIVQREAAERFAGSPYGGETLPPLLLKPWWHIEILRPLRRTDFEPPPSVDSALLWLARRSPALVTPGQAARYRRFIERVFGEAPTVGDALRRVFTRAQIVRLRRELGIDMSVAPSAVAFERWLALYRAAEVLEREVVVRERRSGKRRERIRRE